MTARLRFGVGHAVYADPFRRNVRTLPQDRDVAQPELRSTKHLLACVHGTCCYSLPSISLSNMPLSTSDNGFSVDAWNDRIRPHLSRSMQDVSDAITNAAPVQSWIHEASFKAVEGMGQMHAMQAEAMGHMRMLDDLHETFPELVEAVDALTSGYGRLDIHWRPLTPNFSRVKVSFDRNYDVRAFFHSDEHTVSDMQRVLDTLRDTLPKGDPFPNRPHETTALLVCHDVPLGVRLKEHLADDTRTLSVTLLPENAKPAEGIPWTAAPKAMSDFFGSYA